MPRPLRNIRAGVYAGRIRAELGRQSLSGRDLARLVGVSEPAVSRWLAGLREISRDHQIAIARALDIPLLALFPPMTEDGELVG